MALPQVPVTPEDGSVVISDGTTPSPISLTLNYEDGNLKLEELKHGYRELNVFMTRGRPYAARKGLYLPVKFNFTGHMVGTIDAAETSLIAMHLGLAGTPASGLTSTLAVAKGDGMFLQCKWAFERSNFGGTADGSIAMKYCDLTMNIEEGRPTLLQMAGVAYYFASDAYSWT